MASVPDAKELEGRKKDNPDQAPQSRDFFWDSITLYIVGTILALSAIDVVSEFLRGSDVKCYLPNETDSSLFSSVENYIQEFCSGYLPALQLLPSFIAIHAIAILAPHYVWLNAYGADLDFFFRHVWKLERNRQTDTGDYSPSNYTVSQQLEEAFCKYGRSNGIYWWYISKILLQLFLSLVGIWLVPLVVFTLDEQNVSFQCPASEHDTRGDSWPLPDRETVMCVFSSIYLLQRIWIVYLFLLGLAAFFMLVNLLQLMKWHTAELGFEDCAKFSFETGLSYHYFHPQIVSKVLRKNLIEPFQQNGSSSKFQRVLEFLRYPFSPYNIQSNYDFLMIKLFRTDGGLAYIMKELHVLRLLREMNKTDLSKLNLYRLNVTGSGTGTGDDTGWNLPKFASYSHVPALDEKVLVLPQKFRGFVMGCAHRCEGGYEDRPQIVRFAEDRQKLADAQLDLGKLQTGGQDQREKKQQHDAKEYIAKADELKKYKTSLNRMQEELVDKKGELDAAKSALKEALEFQSDAESVAKMIREDAVMGKQKMKMTNVEQQEMLEGKGTEAGEGSAGATGGAMPGQLYLSNMPDLLSELAKTAAHLQMEVLQLGKSIREATEVHEAHKKAEELLTVDLKRLQTNQQMLAYKQQALAKAQGNSELLRSALKHSGPTLVSALVLGFDMESEGLSAALARIFRRVGFINFSSHYADYKTPLRVTSRSYYIFNATLPADILTRVGLDGNEQLMDNIMEIWYKNFKTTSLSGDKKVSNYVVVGPVSDSMHTATVNRMLSKYQGYLSHHTVVMTIKAERVGGEALEFNEYTPPDDGYTEIPRNVKIEGGSRNWEGATTRADGDICTDSPFTIDLGSTDLVFSFKLYRGCRV